MTEKDTSLKSILNKPPSRVNITGKQYVRGKGSEIIKVKRKQSNWHTPEKKAQVVAAYLALGSAALVESVTGVSRITIGQWRTHQWWKDIEEGIRDEENLTLDAKLSKVVGKTLELLEDRVQNGDFMYDPKKGQLIRKPLTAHVANQILSNSFDKRQILRGKRKEEEFNNLRAEDFLGKLAVEFAKIANRNKENIVVTDIKEIDDAGEIRSDQGLIGGQGETPEGSQNISSQDLQCNTEEKRSSGDGQTQGEIINALQRSGEGQGEESIILSPDENKIY